ncbi:MAG TPA: prepilin-type N-terminal cleavage/methylation domain-containing protein [Verrucomicrobiae bacterium]|nr:prepilin-type N-terminal cleavage/methylation domain-containing protein [Verrucomicrobiae bacterium]
MKACCAGDGGAVRSAPVPGRSNVPAARALEKSTPPLPRSSQRPGRAHSAFTLIEIAISLAVIGIALVAIIGVLPLGMNVQRENREGTVINQDATIFLEAISKGARGMDDLTNYVFAITNYWTLYNSSGGTVNNGQNGYTFGAASVSSGVYPSSPYSSARLTNGAAIVALLSTPEFIADALNLPLTNYPAVPGWLYVGQRYGNTFRCYSNHIIAYVRSISGAAAEKPPQDNQIIRGGQNDSGDAFAYHILCVNAAVPVDTNVFNLPDVQQAYSRQIAANLHELRLTFFWPILPNGRLGTGRQSYRTLIAGQVLNDTAAGNGLYFYQPQSFTNAP